MNHGEFYLPMFRQSIKFARLPIFWVRNLLKWVFKMMIWARSLIGSERHGAPSDNHQFENLPQKLWHKHNIHEHKRTNGNKWKRKNWNFLCLSKMYRFYHEISHPPLWAKEDGEPMNFTRSGRKRTKILDRPSVLRTKTDRSKSFIRRTKAGTGRRRTNAVDQAIPRTISAIKRFNNVCAFWAFSSLSAKSIPVVFPVIQGNHSVPIWVSDGHQISSHPKKGFHSLATDSDILKLRNYFANNDSKKVASIASEILDTRHQIWIYWQ